MKEEREILPFSGRFSRQTWPIITVMFYRWELLDLDNRVTVTMGNLSEIGGGKILDFAQLRMYDRSIHL